MKIIEHSKDINLNEFLLDQNARLIKFEPKTVVIRDRSYTFNDLAS